MLELLVRHGASLDAVTADNKMPSGELQSTISLWHRLLINQVGSLVGEWKRVWCTKLSVTGTACLFLELEIFLWHSWSIVEIASIYKLYFAFGRNKYWPPLGSQYLPTQLNSKCKGNSVVMTRPKSAKITSCIRDVSLIRFNNSKNINLYDKCVYALNFDQIWSITFEWIRSWGPSQAGT